MKSLNNNYAFIRNFRRLEGNRIEYYGPYSTELLLIQHYNHIKYRVHHSDTLSFISTRTFLGENYLYDTRQIPRDLPYDEFVLASASRCELCFCEAAHYYDRGTALPQLLYSHNRDLVYEFKDMFWIRNAVLDFEDNNNFHRVFHGPYDSPEQAEAHKSLVVLPRHKADTQLILTVPEVYKEFEEKENEYSSFEPWYGHLSEAFCEQAVVRL